MRFATVSEWVATVLNFLRLYSWTLRLMIGLAIAVLPNPGSLLTCSCEFLLLVLQVHYIREKGCQGISRPGRRS